MVFFFSFLIVCQPSRLMQKVVPWKEVLRTVFSERLILSGECLVLVSTAVFLKVKQRGKAVVLRLTRSVKLPLPQRVASG